MSLKDELVRLAEACSVCADRYAGREELILTECVDCMEFQRKSELAEVLTDTMHVLAGMQKGERFDLLRIRFRMFLEMDEELRGRELRDMLDTMVELGTEQRWRIERTISDVLRSLPEGESRMLMNEFEVIMATWTNPGRKKVQLSTVKK